MSAADHLNNVAAYGISPLPATPNHATLLNHSTTNKSPQRTDRLEVCVHYFSCLLCLSAWLDNTWERKRQSGLIVWTRGVWVCLSSLLCSSLIHLSLLFVFLLVSSLSSSSVFGYQVCREFKRGNCKRPDADCRYAHPPDHVQVDSNDGLVTVCMDFIKGRCSRDTCRYMHPPPHLQAQLKARSNSNACAGVGGSGVAGIGNHLQQDGSNHSMIPSPILSTQAPPPPNQPQLLPLTALPHHHPLTLAAAAAAASSASRPYRLWKKSKFLEGRRERKRVQVCLFVMSICVRLLVLVGKMMMVHSLTDILHIVMYSRTLGIFDTGDGTHKQIDRCLSNWANPPSEKEENEMQVISLPVCSMSPPSVQYSPHHHTIPRNAECHSLIGREIHSLSLSLV